MRFGPIGRIPSRMPTRITQGLFHSRSQLVFLFHRTDRTALDPFYDESNVLPAQLDETGDLTLIVDTACLSTTAIDAEQGHRPVHRTAEAVIADGRTGVRLICELKDVANVLSNDITSISPADYLKIKVLRTVVGGRTV